MTFPRWFGCNNGTTLWLVRRSIFYLGLPVGRRRPFRGRKVAELDNPATDADPRFVVSVDYCAAFSLGAIADVIDTNAWIALHPLAA